MKRWHDRGRRSLELCPFHGVSNPQHGMPRPVIFDDKRALNRRVVEALANQC